MSTYGIFIPFRDRHAHLDELLPVLADVLKAIPHEVVVVEQADGKPFNRGKLFNSAFSMLGHHYSTIVLHDVDLVPVQADYRNITTATHLSAHCTQFPHGQPPRCFGGVTAFPAPLFAKVNGFNNDYWGWGAEDDDLRDRCDHHGVAIEWRQGRYRSLPHAEARTLPAFRDTYPANLQRWRANQDGTAREYGTNGLSRLRVWLVGLEAYTHETTGQTIQWMKVSL